MKKKLWIIVVILALLCQGCSQPDNSKNNLDEMQRIMDKINEEYGTSLKMSTEEDLKKLEEQGVDVSIPDYSDIDLVEFEKEMRRIAEDAAAWKAQQKEEEK